MLFHGGRVAVWRRLDDIDIAFPPDFATPLVSAP
jgi:hypothetical protein